MNNVICENGMSLIENLQIEVERTKEVHKRLGIDADLIIESKNIATQEVLRLKNEIKIHLNKSYFFRKKLYKKQLEDLQTELRINEMQLSNLNKFLA